MFNDHELSRQYQIRTVGCDNRYKLADRLLATYGYEKAVQICRKNHWTGVIQTLRDIQTM